MLLSATGVPPSRLAEASEPRVHKVQQDKFGHRGIAFREAVAASTDLTTDDWPITGPRTARWCLQFIAQVDGTPRAHHQRFLRENNLKESDLLVKEHSTITQLIELAACWDQLNLAECAMGEFLFRRAQFCELHYKDKQREARADSTFDNEHIVNGTTETSMQFMICPSLEKEMTDELYKSTRFWKERRMAKEVRQQHRGPKPPDKQK